MEADALAAAHTLENGGPAPLVKVSFPFPDIFEYACQIYSR